MSFFSKTRVFCDLDDEALRQLDALFERRYEVRSTYKSRHLHWYNVEVHTTLDRTWGVFVTSTDGQILYSKPFVRPEPAKEFAGKVREILGVLALRRLL